MGLMLKLSKKAEPCFVKQNNTSAMITLQLVIR